MNVTPSTQKAGTLTMTDLLYEGNVALPTVNGTIEAMQFSLHSSTSTPFELDVPVDGHTLVIKSSSLTVTASDTADVKYYATEIEGNLAGLGRVVFTPSTPPPSTPIPSISFTDAVLSLVFVQAPTLTADDLTNESG